MQYALFRSLAVQVLSVLMMSLKYSLQTKIPLVLVHADAGPPLVLPAFGVDLSHLW